MEQVKLGQMGRRIVIVTGASGGIGAAVARALAEHGAVVAAVDRDVERLATLVDELTADGLRAEAYPVDVARRADVEAMVAAVEEDLGPIDWLVNAAGVLRLGRVAELTDEDWQTTFDVNVTGVFHLCRAVVNRMVPRRRGAIVTVSSNAATTPRIEMAAYGAAKAAATMLTRSLGLEVARFGIRCNLVAPGSTDTPMFAALCQDESGRAATIAGLPESYKVGIPLGRIAEPTDVADAVLFLLSDHARHITLHQLTVDGGAGLGA